jgi:hypothetical protein
MKTRLFIVVAAAVLVFPAAAQAKGVSEAKIEGAGLKSPLTIGGAGAGPRLERLALETGLFPALFGQEPDSMLAERPSGNLGPKYTIIYTMPGPDGEATIRQEVYPYATPAPTAYTPAGQPLWDGESTRGGWFAAPSTLKSTLFSADLLAAASSGSDDGFGWWNGALWLAMDAAVLIFLVSASIVVRRRPQPAVTP